MKEKTRPYLTYEEEGENYMFKVFLTNPTDTDYKRVAKRTGAYIFWDDELISTSIAEKELGSLAPNSTILVDKSDLDERDFMIWYEFKLYKTDESCETLFAGLWPYSGLSQAYEK